MAKSKKVPAKKQAKKQIVKKAAKKAPKKTSKAITKKSAVKKKKKGEDLMCFLTTACVAYYGKSDNCQELTMLRDFRDQFLVKEKDGPQLISEYYQIAPTLVQKISGSENPATTYAYIYVQIKKACANIEANKKREAKTVYTNMVTKLRGLYL